LQAQHPGQWGRARVEAPAGGRGAPAQLLPALIVRDLRQDLRLQAAHDHAREAGALRRAAGGGGGGGGRDRAGALRFHPRAHQRRERGLGRRERGRVARVAVQQVLHVHVLRPRPAHV